MQVSDRLLWLSKEEKAKSEHALKPFSRAKGVRKAVPAPVSPAVLAQVHELWLKYATVIGMIPAKREMFTDAMRNKWNTQADKIEYVGAEIRCIQSTTPSQVGLSGICLNEGTNMMYLQDSCKRVVSLPKAECIFDVIFNVSTDDAERKTSYRIVGLSIARNPSLRTKLKSRSIPSLMTI